MVASGLNPGVHVSWLTRAAPEPVRIDVAAFVGIAARGPVGELRVVESWPQFVAQFGDFQPNAFLAYAVRGFFDNGGLRCHIARVAAPPLQTHTVGVQAADGSISTLADTARVVAGAIATLVQDSATLTAGAQPADRASSLVVSVAGFVGGASAVLRQAGASPVVRVIDTIDPVAKRLTWHEPLPASLNIAQPIAIASSARDERLVATVSGNDVAWTRPLDARFDLSARIDVGFGAENARTFIWDEEGQALLSVAATSPGRWGNALSVRVTTSLAADIATRRRSTPDPADRLTLDRLDRLAAGTTVEIGQDGVASVRNTIASVDRANLQVTLAHALVGFDAAGAADGTKPIRVRRLALALSVRSDGRLLESFPDLDLPQLDAPAQSPLNEISTLIRIERVAATDLRWPDPGSPLLDRGEARLSGGRDGVAMLQAQDFTGSADLPPSGMRLFENIDEPAALAMPDILLPEIPARETLPPEPVEPCPCELCPPPYPPQTAAPLVDIAEAAPHFDFDSIVAIQQGMVEHCDARGDRIALLDPPNLSAGASAFDWPELMRWRQRFDSSYAAVYFPWIDVTDPLARAGDLLRAVPPSGHALGQFATADRDPGHDAPANRLLAWTSAVARPIDDEEHALLNENGVNAVLARSGRGIRIMGARTLSSEADWRQLTVRRLFLRLKRSIGRALAWAVFEPVNRGFEDSVVATLEGLLEREWEERRLVGASAEEAFFVRIGRDAAGYDNGEFVVDIGVAPAQPAEFIRLQLVRTLDRLELAELTRSGGWPR